MGKKTVWTCDRVGCGTTASDVDEGFSPRCPVGWFSVWVRLPGPVPGTAFNPSVESPEPDNDRIYCSRACVSFGVFDWPLPALED